MPVDGVRAARAADTWAREEEAIAEDTRAPAELVVLVFDPVEEEEPVLAEVRGLAMLTLAMPPTCFITSASSSLSDRMYGASLLLVFLKASGTWSRRSSVMWSSSPSSSMNQVPIVARPLPLSITGLRSGTSVVVFDRFGSSLLRAEEEPWVARWRVVLAAGGDESNVRSITVPRIVPEERCVLVPEDGVTGGRGRKERWSSGLDCGIDVTLLDPASRDGKVLAWLGAWEIWRDEARPEPEGRSRVKVTKGDGEDVTNVEECCEAEGGEVGRVVCGIAATSMPWATQCLHVKKG
jgi:hypothetical protein